MPPRTGVYRVLDDDFSRPDVEFEQVYARAQDQKRRSARAIAPPVLTSVNLAVADSGIYTSAYFAPRLVAGGDFTGGYACARVTNGRPATTGVHGSHVASIASFGTAMIKLIDVQVGSTQEGGQNNPEVWINGLKWAIGAGARVVNCSVNVPWEHPAIQAIVSGNSGVLFLATAGNNETELDATFRRAGGASYNSGNTIIVSGCKEDGTKEVNRGFGSAVDIYAPSVNVPGLAAAEVQRAKYDADQARKAAERNAQIDAEAAMKAERLRSAQDELEEARRSGNMMRIALIEKGIRNLQAGGSVPYTPPPFGALPSLSDSGSSFAIPMVANVAAKMILINQGLTPARIIDIIKGRATSVATNRMLDPVACYEAALESRNGG